MDELRKTDTSDQQSRIWKEEAQIEEAMQGKNLQRPMCCYLQSRSGSLSVPCEVLEDQLNKTYSDPDRAVPLLAVEWLVRPAGPSHPFDLSDLSWC